VRAGKLLRINKMDVAQGIRDISQLFAEIFVVPIAILEKDLAIYEQMKGSPEYLSALLAYIEIVEEFQKRVLRLQDEVFLRINKDADTTVALSVSMKKDFSKRRDLSEAKRNELIAEADKLIQGTGRKVEELVAQVTRIYDPLIERTQNLLNKATDLKKSFY
jgi:hypothetical protein